MDKSNTLVADFVDGVILMERFLACNGTVTTELSMFMVRFISPCHFDKMHHTRQYISAQGKTEDLKAIK